MIASVTAIGVNAAASASSKIGGTVSVWNEFSGAEATGFATALKPFESKTGVKVTVRNIGSSGPTLIEAAVAGGKPPDIAAVPTPGSFDLLAAGKRLTPLKPILGSEVKNFSAGWNAAATYKGTLYGLWLDSSSKNTVFYNPAVFKAAGITSTPTTFEQMLTDASTIAEAGYTPISFCSGTSGAGWSATDLFQNLFVKLNGAVAYNDLVSGKLSWTSPEVTATFANYSSLLGANGANVGGISNALGTDQLWPTCVNDVFPTSGSPTAAMVIEASFVEQTLPSNYTPSDDSSCTLTQTNPCYDYFPFPAPAGSKYVNNDQSSGDVAMLMKSTKASRALMQYLGSKQFATAWEEAPGGTITPNLAVPASALKNPVTASIVKNLNSATATVFSMDDEYGGTLEPEMWSNMLAWIGGTDTTAQFQSTMQSETKAYLAANG
ncbi:MAG TPA: ABC transporter substrate-binding protein [Acidimicrobiales bacterium]|nr:ABC transporter substrate-binding protein [Acidimicrobiales bacterium]